MNVAGIHRIAPLVLAATVMVIWNPWRSAAFVGGMYLFLAAIHFALAWWRWRDNDRYLRSKGRERTG